MKLTQPSRSLARFYKIAAGFAVALAAFGLFKWMTQPPDPVHNGKRASEWIAALATGGEETETAKQALLALDAAAVPLLNQRLMDGRSIWNRPVLAKFRNSLPGAVRSRIGEPVPGSVRLEIMQLAPKLGATGQALAPALAENTRPAADMLNHFAIQSLGLMGTNGVQGIPALLQVLDGQDPIARRSAVLALARIGHLGSAELNRLRTLVNDTNPWVSNFASLALWKHDFTQEHDRALLSILERLELSSRITMMNLIVELHPSKTAATEMLWRQAESSTASGTIRDVAMQNLRKLEPDTDEPAP